MIQTILLTKRFGQRDALDGLTLTIGGGEIFGFLGPNGAGKTTTIRMLAGMLNPTSGRILICGLDMAKEAVDIKRIIGVIPDRPFLYEKLSGEEFLLFLAGIRSLPSADARRRIDELLAFFELTEWRHEWVESYSHGMKQRLALCGALLHKPKALIVDEPMVGLDPRGARHIKNLFVTLAREGVTIFLSTHSLDVAEAICHRVGLIQRGRLLAVGTPDELKTHPGEHLEEVFLTLVREEKEHAPSV